MDAAQRRTWSGPTHAPERALRPAPARIDVWCAYVRSDNFLLMSDSTLAAAALDDRYVIEGEIGALSRDGRRVVVNVRDYRADAWMSRVIR